MVRFHSGPWVDIQEKSMKSIKRVKSMDYYGCAVACLAMITDKSYFQMREKLSKVYDRQMGKIVRSEQLGIPITDLYDILRTHLHIRCVGAKFVVPMKNHCILFLTPVNLRYFTHAVVWDAKKQRILDPDSDGKNILDDFNISYCIEILPPKKGLELEPEGQSQYWRFDGIGPRVRLTQDKIEYVLRDLSFGEFEKTTKRQRIHRLTKAMGLSYEQIKTELRGHTLDKNIVSCV